MTKKTIQRIFSDGSGVRIQTVTVYHIFSDGADDFTRNWKEALELYRLHKQDSSNVRLYKEVYANERDYEDDLLESENCIYAIGNTPI